MSGLIRNVGRVGTGALLGALLVATPLVAQEKQGRVGPPPASVAHPLTEQMDALALARQLASYGTEHEAPYALVAAARLLIDTPAEALLAQMSGSEGEGLDPTDAGELSLDAALLLSSARDLLRSDDPLVPVIDDLRQQAGRTRGAVGGPKYAVEIVNAESTNYYVVSFEGSERAVVTVDGDDDTDLDCYVYDENGYLIDSDLNYSDYCYLEWTPSWTGPFRIEVVNLGRVWNRYIIQTN